MPRKPLKVGEHNIATTTPRKLDANGKKAKSQKGRGTWTMVWYANVDNEVRRHSTTIVDGYASDCRARAAEQFAELLEQAHLPEDGAWTKSSFMREYVESECIPAVEALGQGANPSLRPRTVKQYVTRLRHYADAVGNMRIADAVVPYTMQSHFDAIADAHGIPTAKYCVKSVGKYVLAPLMKMTVITYSPIREGLIEIKAPDAAAKLVPTPAERERVVAHLLDLDPTTPGTRGHSEEVMTAKRANVIDITLLQAVSGLRITEARMLKRGDCSEVDGRLHVTVTTRVSKTHKSRTIPLLDDRVAKRMRERIDGLDYGDYVFPAPHGGLWDENNARKLLREFYDDLADELGIPALRQRNKVTHIWRTSLNTEWRDAGVPREWRVAYLGHTEEVNEASYTQDVTFGRFIEMVGKS